jgi:hypothetical protein
MEPRAERGLGPGRLVALVGRADLEPVGRSTDRIVEDKTGEDPETGDGCGDACSALDDMAETAAAIAAAERLGVEVTAGAADVEVGDSGFSRGEF